MAITQILIYQLNYKDSNMLKANQYKPTHGGYPGKPPEPDAFIKHLEYASETVRQWPTWKQQLLGGTKTEQVTT